MSIVLNMRPKDLPVTFAEFIKTAPPYSIAIDGYLSDGPRFDENGPWLNLDHHKGVERLATRATCGQAIMAVRQDLFKLFSDENGPRAQVFANHCDEDVCLTWFIIKNCHLTKFVINPLLNRLIFLEDTLDSTAGAYPFPSELPSLGELAWVFDPYRRFRISGRIQYRDEKEFAGIVEDVNLRIEKYITGAQQSIPLDTRYKIIGGGPGWVMINEIGTNARTGLFNDNYRAYVSVRYREDGRFEYVVGRMSMFIKFPVLRIFEALNEAEDTGADKWGGADTIGGSPRIMGSSLPPEEVQRIINDVIGKNK